MKINLISELDQSFAIIGIILSLLLTFFIISSNKQVIYLIPGVLSLIFCLIWLKIRKMNISLVLPVHDSKDIMKILLSVFFLLFVVSMIVFYLRSNLYERPLVYFFLISLMSSIIALEILFNAKNYFSKVILFQTIIIGISLVVTGQLMFPSVVGVDPAWHQMFTLKILANGHIPEGFNYSNLPFAHVEMAITSLLGNLNFKLASIISISIVQIIGLILFIFLIGRTLFNENVGLISALLLSTANCIIQFGSWTIPNTIAALYIPFILYLLFKNENTKIIIGLIMFLMIGLILTHTVTSLWMVLVLIVGILIFNINKLNNKDKSNKNRDNVYISINLLLFFAVFMIFWWMNSSGLVFSNVIGMLQWGLNVDHTGLILTNSYSNSIPLIEKLYNNMGLFLFSGISLLGFLYILSKKDYNSALFGFIALSTLSVGFFSLITSKDLLNERWFYFAEILIAPLVAIGLIIILNTIKRKKIVKIVMPLFFCILSFIMITSLTAEFDNSTFFPDMGSRSALTTSEVDAAYFFSLHSITGIKSDFYYAVNPSSSIFINYDNMSVYNMSLIDSDLLNRSFSLQNNNIIILRKEIVNNPFSLEGGVYKLNYDPNDLLLNDSNFNKIYDSSSVTGYMKY